MIERHKYDAYVRIAFEKISKALLLVLVFMVAGTTFDAEAQRNSESDAITDGKIANLDLQYSDSELRAKKLTLNFSNVSIEKLLQYIEQKKNVQFSYNKEILAGNPKITISLEDVNLDKALTEIFKETTIEHYAFNDGYIVLRESSKKIVLETVQGTVTDAETNEALPGVNIAVKGTTTGTSTNTEGRYSLNVPSLNDTLVFSFIGFQTREVPINGRTNIDIVMQPAQITGEELVVIGYGEAQSRDLTAPISSVSSEEIAQTVSTNAASALQGAVPGLQVTNVGSPGESPEIRIRGIGSMQGAQPLYVVDGMFYNDINWLNSNDIESISVLKDASAASIYGVRASGGVIVVETKDGSFNQDVVIEYDGYVGLNSTSNLMERTTTEQYATMMIEAGLYDRMEPSINEWGGESFTHNGTEYTIPQTDTDWYQRLLGSNGGSAPIMNHSLTLRGGSENTKYKVGASYTGEEGLFKNAEHKWERINVNARINFVPYDFLDVGANVNLNQTNESNPVDVWAGMYYAVPTMPVRNSDSEEDFAGAIQAGYNVGPVNNPAAALYYTQGYGNRDKFLNLDYNAFTNLKFLGDDRLVLKTQFSHHLEYSNSRFYSPQYNVDDKLENENSDLNKGYANNSTMHLDNTLTYKNQFGAHNITAMSGFSVRQQEIRNIGGYAANVPGEEEHYLYFNNATDPAPSNFDVSDGGFSEVGLSAFGRLSYNYDHKYLLNATFRADGTDKYSQTWGYFPSVGVGWVLTEEQFMDNQRIFDNLKIRASWGRLGNNNVPRESGSNAITTGNNVSYVYGGDIVPGYRPSVFFNRLKWEVTDEYNAGVEMVTLDNRLTAEVDWFRKITKEAAISVSNLMGDGSLIRNQGEILNTGLEFSVEWEDNIGELDYNISTNVSTLKNEVLTLGGQPYIDGGSSEFPYRTEPGHELHSWYGYEVIGVYQTQSEVESHIDTDVHSQVEAGFLKFEDVNGDGIIDFQDRQHLGANIPELTYGGTIRLNYKNFDFSTSIYGVTGNSILNRLRAERGWHADFNFDTDLYQNRWTGQGSTDSYPSAAGMIHPWNMNSNNSFLTESGAYFRVQNITLGYTFNNLIPGSNRAAGSSVRIRLTAQNPFTAFDFNGFTPEATGVGEVRGVNPIPTSYTVGVNITY